MSQTPASPAPFLNEDRGCIRCAYNLRGLPPTGLCPECGTPVADSLRGFLLQYAGEPYVRSLCGGLSLVLNGILLSIALMVVVTVLAAVTGAAGAHAMVELVMLVPTAMIFVGYWRYTAPDPGYVGQEPPRAARQVARAAVGVQAATQVGNAVLVVAPIPGAAGLVGGVLNLVGLAAWVVQFVAIMRYTRWLAARVPDRWVVARARTYAWLLPLLTIAGAILLMLGPLVALILYWNLLDRMRKHLKSILACGEPAEVRRRLG